VKVVEMHKNPEVQPGCGHWGLLGAWQGVGHGFTARAGVIVAFTKYVLSIPLQQNREQ
jgi:hypothetical protein